MEYNEVCPFQTLSFDVNFFYCNERKRNRFNNLGVKRQINIPLYIFYVGVNLQSSCAECSKSIRLSITLHLLLLGNF